MQRFTRETHRQENAAPLCGVLLEMIGDREGRFLAGRQTCANPQRKHAEKAMMKDRRARDHSICTPRYLHLDKARQRPSQGPCTLLQLFWGCALPSRRTTDHPPCTRPPFVLALPPRPSPPRLTSAPPVPPDRGEGARPASPARPPRPAPLPPRAPPVLAPLPPPPPARRC